MQKRNGVQEVLEIKELDNSRLREAMEIKCSCRNEELAGKAYELFNVDEQTGDWAEWTASAAKYNDVRITVGAYVDGVLSGVAAASFAEATDIQRHGIELNGLWVKRDYRGRNISLRLLLFLLDRFEKLGINRIVVYNFHYAPSNAYYRKLGFFELRNDIQTVVGNELPVDVFCNDTYRLRHEITKRLSPSAVCTGKDASGNGFCLTTERLILREMTEGDFDSLYSIFSDAETMRHYPSPFDRDTTLGWIRRNTERYRDFGFGLWAVTLKTTGEVIGDCGITMQVVNGAVRPEIGYHICKDCQNRGYATEAASACRDRIFDTTPFNRLYSFMKYTNVASSAVARKIGMKLIDAYDDPVNTRTLAYAVSRDDNKTISTEVMI